jgi:thiosulfate/3-mercaptopyruvate sulfurtransferase
MPKYSLFAAALLISVTTSLSAQGVRDLPMLVEPEDLQTNLDVPELIVVNVDLERTAYDVGHIPGASFLPLDGLGVEVDGVVSPMPPFERLMLAAINAGIYPGTYVVLYGAPLATARAWTVLDIIGFSQTTGILNGGLDAWKTAGLPLSTDPPKPREADFSAYPSLLKIVDAAWIQEHLEDSTVVFLDARPAAAFAGASPGAGSQMPGGHIPGAHNLPWEELLRSSTDRHYRTPEELQARFESAGATSGKTIVVYGSSGINASVLYFVSRLLGYPTRLYDAAITDWVGRRLPVVTGASPR